MQQSDGKERMAAIFPPASATPQGAEVAHFREPWEAHAFAMALLLNRAGLFTWSEWAATLGEEIRRAQQAGDPDTGETYWRHWLAALEKMVANKDIATRAALKRHYHAWEHAAQRTPHGTPIELLAEDYQRS